MDVAQGGLAIGQLHSCDSQRPDVSLEAVAILLDDFGCHPEWGANKGVPLTLDIGELSSDSEVSQLDLAAFREQDIGGLDISVDLALSVEVLDAE
jgi:hypothetical protein